MSSTFRSFNLSPFSSSSSFLYLIRHTGQAKPYVDTARMRMNYCGTFSQQAYICFYEVTIIHSFPVSSLTIGRGSQGSMEKFMAYGVHGTHEKVMGSKSADARVAENVHDLALSCRKGYLIK